MVVVVVVRGNGIVQIAVSQKPTILNSCHSPPLQTTVKLFGRGQTFTIEYIPGVSLRKKLSRMNIFLVYFQKNFLN